MPFTTKEYTMSQEEKIVGQVFDAESILTEVDAEESEPVSDVDGNAKSEPEPKKDPQANPEGDEKDSDPKTEAKPKEEPTPEDLGDIWDTSKDDPRTAARMKKAQALLTRESQSKSAIEKEAQSHVNQLEQVRAEILRVISSGDAHAEVDKIRQQLGLALPQKPQEVQVDYTGVKTPEDLFARNHEALNKAMTAEREAMKAEFRTEVARMKQEASQQVAQAAVPAIKAKWNDAIKDLRTDYGTAFAEVEDHVKEAVGKGKFGLLYDRNEDGAEKKVLLAAFRELYPDAYLDAEISKRATKAKAVSSKSTESGKAKSNTKKTAVKAPSSGSFSEDVLAEVDADLGQD